MAHGELLKLGFEVAESTVARSAPVLEPATDKFFGSDRT
jgi:hypothetical protein